MRGRSFYSGAVPTRRGSGDFFEQANKVIDVIDTDGRGDIADGVIRRSQQLARTSNPAAIDIYGYAAAEPLLG